MSSTPKSLKSLFRFEPSSDISVEDDMYVLIQDENITVQVFRMGAPGALATRFDEEKLSWYHGVPRKSIRQAMEDAVAMSKEPPATTLKKIRDDLRADSEPAVKEIANLTDEQIVTMRDAMNKAAG